MILRRTYVALLWALLILGCESDEPQAPTASVQKYFVVTEEGYHKGLNSLEERPDYYGGVVGITAGGKRFGKDGKANVMDMFSEPPTRLRMTPQEMKHRTHADIEGARAAYGLEASVNSFGEGRKSKKRSRRRNRSRRGEAVEANAGIQVEYVQGGLSPVKVARGGKGRGFQAPASGTVTNHPGDSSKWKPVVMYSGSWCPHCRRAKRWLKKNRVPYEEVEVGKKNSSGDARYNAAVRRAGGDGGVPFFEIGKDRRPMGGWSSGAFKRLAAR